MKNRRTKVSPKVEGIQGVNGGFLRKKWRDVIFLDYKARNGHVVVVVMGRKRKYKSANLWVQRLLLNFTLLRNTRFGKSRSQMRSVGLRSCFIDTGKDSKLKRM